MMARQADHPDRRRGRSAGLGLAAFLLALTAACGPQGQEAPDAPHSVPRSRTLITDCAEIHVCGGQIHDYDTFNPFVPQQTSRTGWHFSYEPLYFYNAFAPGGGELIPWIAEGYEYSDDYRQLTVHIRPGVRWSDGEPWTAHDVVFTLNLLKASAPDLLFSTDIAKWVDAAVAVDSLTLRVRLTAPNPRFMFTYLTNTFGIGIPIVPRHIWQGQDPHTFANLDLQRGWPVVSGPYRLTHTGPAQRIWDRRDDWWAARTGFHAPPRVERIIFLPYMDETRRIQGLASNAMDTSLDLRPANIRRLIDDNPNITTWTGREPPYGYLDFWPVSLGFNDLEPPFDDPEVRWAVNFAIDRAALVADAWGGAGSYTLVPFPDAPPLRPYIDAIDDLLTRYPVGTHDPQRTAAILERKGWVRERGVWTKDGHPLRILVDIAPVFQDLAPVLVDQLQAAGFDANFRGGQEFSNRMNSGRARAYMAGHAGSLRDPYYTLSLYHSRHVRPTGQMAQYPWRWSNPAFDAIVERMGHTPPGDPRLTEQFRQAMAIWLAELPSIPLVQWYHRIPINDTYWQGWPSEDDPYIHLAYFHRTFELLLLGLVPSS